MHGQSMDGCAFVISSTVYFVSTASVSVQSPTVPVLTSRHAPQCIVTTYNQDQTNELPQKVFSAIKTEKEKKRWTKGQREKGKKEKRKKENIKTMKEQRNTDKTLKKVKHDKKGKKKKGEKQRRRKRKQKMRKREENASELFSLAT